PRLAHEVLLLGRQVYGFQDARAARVERPAVARGGFDLLGAEGDNMPYASVIAKPNHAIIVVLLSNTPDFIRTLFICDWGVLPMYVNHAPAVRQPPGSDNQRIAYRNIGCNNIWGIAPLSVARCLIPAACEVEALPGHP